MGYRGRRHCLHRLRAPSRLQATPRRPGVEYAAEPLWVPRPIDRLQRAGLSYRRGSHPGKARDHRLRGAYSRCQSGVRHRGATEQIRRCRRDLRSAEVLRKLLQLRIATPHRRGRLVCSTVRVVGKFAPGDPRGIHGTPPGLMQQHWRHGGEGARRRRRCTFCNGRCGLACRCDGALPDRTGLMGPARRQYSGYHDGRGGSGAAPRALLRERFA